MSDPIIRVENLGKKYVIGHQSDSDTFRDRITGFFSRKSKILMGMRGPHLPAERKSEEFWALRDVSFEINRGEVIGIIGRNGAGKSTLLKILSRITEPTTGRITLDGRVASLLEVGTGFHPELTGRENIFLNGAILGMSRSEIRKKFDEIVAFAEIERFLDTPVKRYSSGMYVRLAFAVAAHLDPEILIVDEVLAVGDAQFQKKCLGKMQDFSRQQGRTVLLVSHNPAVIGAFCNQVIHLSQGLLAGFGATAEQLSQYQPQLIETDGANVWPPDHPANSSQLLRLCEARIRVGEQTTTQPKLSEDIWIEYDFEVLVPVLTCNSSLHLFDGNKTWVLASGPPRSATLTQGRYRHACRIPGGLLNDCRYSVNLFLLSNLSQVEVSMPDALSFTVQDDGSGRTEYFGPIGGVIRPALDWSNEPLPTGA